MAKSLFNAAHAITDVTRTTGRRGKGTTFITRVPGPSDGGAPGEPAPTSQAES